jgi:RNA polymerase sigma-70 factor, ECF subfamily
MANTLRAEALVACSMDFEGLVREHQAMVFSLAYHLLHDRAAAEEIAQDVFVQLHSRVGRLESPEHVKFWLRRTASHRSIDCLRKRKLRAETALEDAPEPAAAANPGDPMLSRRLRQLVASLPEKARMIVVLRYQEDMELAEIAKTMAIPVNTVRSHLHRSLALLRDKVQRTMGSGVVAEGTK